MEKTTLRYRRCRCGAILLPSNPALVCSMECLAADMSNDSAPFQWKTAVETELTWNPPAVGTIPIPTRLMVEMLKLGDAISMMNEEPLLLRWAAKHKPPMQAGTQPLQAAVSRAQVNWARGQLEKIEQGLKPTTDCSREQLQAYADTPLNGLPERAGDARSKPARTRKGTSKPRAAQ